MSILNKSMLAATGALVSTALVEKKITWVSGGSENTATVFVRPLSYASAVSGVRSKDHVAARIASCICDESGNKVFTESEITGEIDPDRDWETADA
jgi:hypothetical protein